ncbi:MAG: 30S ribosomal protein S6 [Candidatus Omnitrophota bacterium]
MKRNYESMVILKPDLGSEEHEEIFAKIIKKIESSEGKVSASKIWAKEKNFCYLLRERGGEKKKYYKGCYWLINFSLDGPALPGLKEVMRLEERILRNIILNKEF